MVYALGILAILAVVFGAFIVPDFSDFNKASIFDGLEQSFKNLIPKNKNDILVESLSANYATMGDFFDETAQKLLNSKAISEQDKIVIKKAIDAFKSSDSLNNQVTTQLKQNKENKTGIIDSLVNSILKGSSLLTSSNSTGINPPSPTYIPPQCRLVCDD